MLWADLDVLHYFALPLGYQQLDDMGLLPAVLSDAAGTFDAIASRLLEQVLVAAGRGHAVSPMRTELAGRLLQLALRNGPSEQRLLHVLAYDERPAGGAAVREALVEPLAQHFASHAAHLASAIVRLPERPALAAVLSDTLDFLIGRRKFLKERYRAPRACCAVPLALAAVCALMM